MHQFAVILKWSAFALAATLMGCVTRQVEGVDFNREFYVYHEIRPLSTLLDEQDVDVPSLGVVTSTEVGNSMVAKYRVGKLPHLDLLEGREISVHYDKSQNFEAYLPAGTYQLQGFDGAGGRYYSSPTPLRIKYVERQKPPTLEQGKPHTGGIFVDATGQTYAYLTAARDTDVFRISVSGLKINFKLLLKPAANASLRRELIYAGRSQSTISLLYREFLDDMARPAFSQSFQYDISNSPMIGYKGARFEVLEANNLSIKYRALKHLD